MSDHNQNKLAKSNNQVTQSQPTSIGVRATKQEVEIYLAPQGKRLEEFKNKEMNDLKNVVVKWVYMLGLTNKVSDKDIIANTAIITDLFPKITLRQLELAIKLSLQGILNVDAEPYGNFSPIYVSKIIQAYLTYSNSKIKEVNWRKASIDKMNEKQIEAPYTERLKARRDILDFYIQTILSKDAYLGDYNNSMWELLKRLNMLDPKTLPLDEADGWAKNRVQLESQTIDKKYYSKLNPNQRKEAMETKQKSYARYYVMRYIFMNMKQPNDWIKSIKDEIILPN